MGQPLPGSRGRRGFASLLVLVQEPRLDPHTRQTSRTAGLPRRGAGRLRPTPALSVQHHRPGCRLGRTQAYLHRQPRERRARGGQHRRERARSAQLPQVPGLAWPRRLRGPQVPHIPLGARARPDRQAGGPGRNRFDGEPGRPRDRTVGRPPLLVPAGARVGRPQGRSRLHTRRARDLPEQAATAHHAVEGGVPAREEPDRRSDPPARHQDQRRCASSNAAPSSSGYSRTDPIWPRPSLRSIPTRASDRSSTRPSIRRSCGTTWSSFPMPSSR